MWQRGSPQYMPPEIFSALGNQMALSQSVSVSVMQARDVYAFGIMMNELLSRIPPWEGLENPSIRQKVTSGLRPAQVGTNVSLECLCRYNDLYIQGL